jgi:hypothetical protein
VCYQGDDSGKIPGCEGTGIPDSGYCVAYRLKIPTGVDKDATNRDVHGQLLDNSDPAFTYEVLMNEGKDACRSLERYGFSELEHGLLCSPRTCAWNVTAVMETDKSICEWCALRDLPQSPCLLKANPTDKEKEEGPECQRKCQVEKSDAYYNRITRGVELVFGDKPSVGFICSTKEAVINDGKDLPGFCCLDAPYQLDVSNWGNAVSLEIESDSKRSHDD